VIWLEPENNRPYGSQYAGVYCSHETALVFEAASPISHNPVYLDRFAMPSKPAAQLSLVLLSQRQALLRSFIKHIAVNKKQVTVHYNPPMPKGEKSKERMGVLPN
jgi:hypothetical protein